MASKMKKTKKQRTHKTSPNTAGPKRRETQEAAAAVNKQNGFKPWDTVKATRMAERIRQGKPAAWRKRQEAASVYKSRGKDKVPA